MFDLNKLPANACVAIYGCGEAGLKVKKYIDQLGNGAEVLFFIDSFKRGEFEGLPVVKFADFCEIGMNNNVDKILIASSYHKEIGAQLAKKNIANAVLVEPYFWNYHEKDWQLDLYEELYTNKTLMDKQFYNIGAGCFRHPYWHSVDYVQTHYDTIISSADPNLINYDLMSREPLPLESGLAEVFYSSHTLEHIDSESMAFVLKDIYRCLKKEGILRLVLPDVDLYYRAFLDNDFKFHDYDSSLSMEQFFVSSFATHIAKKYTDKEIRRIFSEMSYEEALDHFSEQCSKSNQRKNPSSHMNWFNYKKIEKCLYEAGFKNVRRSGFGQSSVPILRNTSLFDNSHSDIALYVEAVR